MLAYSGQVVDQLATRYFDDSLCILQLQSQQLRTLWEWEVLGELYRDPSIATYVLQVTIHGHVIHIVDLGQGR